ncbi:MAG: RAD55 family ATPase [Haloarculaceae archaeon]
MARSTGDATFDELLGGGVPDGRALLLRGPPGAGTRRLARQFLTAAPAADGLLVTTTTPYAVAAADTTTAGDDVAAIRPVAGDRVRLRTADGETTVDLQDLPDRLLAPEYDRITVEGLAGLFEAAPDPADGRALLQALSARVAECDASLVATASPADPAVLEEVAAGVVTCWIEEIEGDARRFLRVRALDGVDHDTRRHALAREETGVGVAAREWATHDRPLPTGIDSFDAITGGFVRAGTTVFEHTGTADHWPFSAALAARAIDEGTPVVLITAPGTLRNRVNDLLAAPVGPVTELMDRDLLYLLDPVSRDPETPALDGLPEDNVVLQEVEGSVQAALRTLVDDLGSRVEEAVAILEHTALQHLVDENQSRQLFYWADGAVMNGEYDLSLVLTVDRAVSGERLVGFFTGVADQVVRTWRGADELQYLSVPKSPAGTPGHTRVVEPLERPPYVRLR